jgi:inner membrane protein
MAVAVIWGVHHLMPSLLSHPAVPLALAAALPREIISPGLIVLGMVCSTVPDLDVVGFRFGISYGHVLGHRGLSHSALFAALLADGPARVAERGAVGLAACS